MGGFYKNGNCRTKFRGYETNFIITHSDKFAAAASGAGVSNCVSHYNGLFPHAFRENSGQGYYEGSQMRIGATLWQSPELYISNSPIFYIDKVRTPIVIMHNKNDEAVPWMQSVELFNGLRRLQKKAWMLQYDNGGMVSTMVEKMEKTSPLDLHSFLIII